MVSKQIDVNIARNILIMEAISDYFLTNDIYRKI